MTNMITYESPTIPEQVDEDDIGGWEMDYSNRKVYWTDNLYRIYGVDKSAFTPTVDNHLSFVYPDDLPYIQKQINELHQTEKPFDAEFRIKRPDGEIRTVHARGDVVYDDNRQILRVIGAVIDLTRTKLERHRLLELNALYNLLAENTQDIITYLLPDGTIEYSSPAVKNILGYSPEELRGTNHADYLHPEHSLPEHLNPNSDTVEALIRHKNGHYVWTESKFKVIRDKAGVHTHTIGVTKDITAKKQAEERINRAEKLALVGKLAAGIAHEIRNPITALRGFYQIIKEYGPKKDYDRIVMEEFSRIEKILTDLLQLARPKPSEFAAFELTPLVHDVATLLEAQARERQVRIEICHSGAGQPVWCDDSQIKQVLLNLTRNAIEAMQDGGVVRLGVCQDGGEAVLRITDQGEGISAERMVYLGQPFQTTKEQGTGLGLMLCYAIIEHHKGRIVVESCVGVGTTFEVRLPLHRKPAS
ncbi:PAS domain-containing protein [Paenibacillus chartarius]|uniref:histidine kinase n=1 Tax=Paenibacillus chartarius TaxID=747481 RepID=A0ABV6DV93_9BACL